VLLGLYEFHYVTDVKPKQDVSERLQMRSCGYAQRHCVARPMTHSVFIRAPETSGIFRRTWQRQHAGCRLAVIALVISGYHHHTYIFIHYPSYPVQLNIPLVYLHPSRSFVHRDINIALRHTKCPERIRAPGYDAVVKAWRFQRLS
jgi:hypothetical protein